MKRSLVVFALLALVVSSAAFACDKEAGMKTAGHECPVSMKGVERTVTNLDNGVRIEMASADPAMIQTLQTKMAAEGKGSCCKDCVMSNAAWSKKVENTPKGVVVTVTAGSKDEVGKLQTMAAGMTKGGCGHMGEVEKGECPHKAAQKGTKA
jgi:hypothetical protein